MSRDTHGFDVVYVSNVDIVADIISNWPGFDKYATKLRRIRDDVMERGYRTYDVNENHFNTLVHDDIWTPNLMIKSSMTNDIEKPFENLMFLDFQFSNWSSPAIDLYYFMNSSLCDSVRSNHSDELVRFYYEHLATDLKRLNFRKQIPTWPEFFKQYQQRNFYGKALEPIMCRRINSIILIHYSDFGSLIK